MPRSRSCDALDRITFEGGLSGREGSDSRHTCDEIGSRVKATFNIRSLRFEGSKEDLSAEMWSNPAEPRESGE
jgi:hypothetical protein